MSHAEKDDYGTWAVYRQDDYGNRFLVRGGLAHDDAGRVAAELAARGHKQLYWVEREQPAGLRPGGL